MNIIQDVRNQGHGTCDPIYLFIHETANPGASAYNHSLLYGRGYDYAVQYVSDWTGNVYHCVPDNRLAWGVGNGNRYGVNLEICHATNAEDFKKTWDTAVEFVAWYLKSREWNTSNLMSHDECRIKWGGTTHTDPISYFKKYGKTWNDFKNEVAAKLKASTGTVKKEDDLKPITNTGGKIYSFYNAKNGAHFLGTEEKGKALGSGWKKEGTAFTAPKGGIKAVFQLRNPNAGTYMYTISYAEATNLQKAGWVYECVPFFAKETGTAIYRMYNPNTGDHHFTASKAEADSLVKAGWKNEGVAFYM